MSTKMGRPPSKNPKSEPIHVRLDKKSMDILARYCEQEGGISRTEGIRRGIQLLEDELKK